ncbi:thiol-disulfide isomerase/thioredoxin [Runella defluvii]|uniref:Thiol-disulfide isomerase/thioredoxin n=1 Tax=Runella defluvii TaxID=370973 RepID=A0A7W5ZNT3_9BACT|nr:thioredoxin-like domain-containing protein [Runella defluvii]MBB3840845.1 thiol-disulfide isomerase/thioredoxin [Runella defluvii]
MKKIALLLFTYLLYSQSWAQSGYKIEGTIKGLKPGAYTLAHYFGYDQTITKDTALVDDKGVLSFTGSKSLPEGLYMVLKPNKSRLLDFIVGPEQHFSFVSDTLSIVGNMKIEGSPDNERFFNYQQKMLGYSQELTLVQAQAKVRQDMISQAKIGTIRRQMSEYYHQFVKENAATFTGKILSASNEIALPTPPKRPDGRPDSAWLFNYYRAHFWDNFDFSDERLVRTPFLQRKLERYLQNLTFPAPDSLIQASDYVIGKALKGGSKEMQAYCIWYLTNQAETPNTVGGDAVFVHLAEKYYLGGIMPITDSSTVQNIRSRVAIMKPLLVGKSMPALALSDTARIGFKLADIQSKYTVVFFYDPDCGHCRQSTPELKRFSEKYTSSVKVLAVSVTGSPDNWKKYIHDFGVGAWRHGYDFSFRTDFRKEFDVVNTPMVYVLDKDKKIIARKMAVEQLDSFIDFYEEQSKLSKK